MTGNQKTRASDVHEIYTLFKNVIRTSIAGLLASDDAEHFTSTEKLVMFALLRDTSTAASLTEIATQIVLSLSAASRAMSELVRSGYVQRFAHANDARMAQFKLTAKGLKVAGHLADLIRIALTGFSPKERAMVSKFLATFRLKGAGL